MSPEQFTPNESVDYALVDIYAVGTTLYYMVTGELPFKGDNEFALRDAKLFQEPVKPSKLNPAISSKMDNLILKSLHKTPSERIQSADAMQQALEDISPAAKKTSSKKEPTADEKTVSITTGEVSLGRKKKTPLYIAASLVVIAIIVIAVIFFGKETPIPPEPPLLLSPVNDDLIAIPYPTFRWEGSEESGTEYLLEYSTDSTFTSPEARAGLTLTEYQLRDSLADGMYFWRVKTVEPNGQESNFSRIFRFEIEVPEPLATTDENTVETQEETPVNNIVREERKPQPPPLVEIKTGRMLIGSRPYLQAEIYIDGKKTSEQTPFTFTRKPGIYEIRVVLDRDGKTMEAIDTVEVRPDTLMTYNLQLEE
jgi:serine/threonine protein kinase